MTNNARSSTRAALSQWRIPHPDGLPSRGPLVAFPILLLVALAVLVGLGITGSSTGIFRGSIYSGRDPQLIAGTPEAVRSDEWLVQTPLVISQFQEGLPRYNHGFPGGIDTTVQSDLPSRDWSMIFRPHLIGFLVLPLDQASSLRWWLPAFALIGSCYIFALTLMPRRPLTAATVSIGFFFAPFFQWWFLPITFWPVAWSFLVMATSIWLLRSTRRTPRIILTTLSGYLAVTVAVGVYVPFMVPALLVAAGFVVGVLCSRTALDLGWRVRLRRLLPLGIAAIAAAAVVGIWVATRVRTIDAFGSTLYPGQRLTPPGTADQNSLLSLGAAPFTRTLGTSTPALDVNPSEASSFLLMGLILIVPLVWSVRTSRREGRLDMIPIALLVVLVMVTAYLVLPGWGQISHFLLLDRTTAQRVRPAFGILAVVILCQWGQETERRRVDGTPQMAWGRVAGMTVAAAATVAVPGLWLFYRHESLVTDSRIWLLTAPLSVLAISFAARGRMLWAGVSLLVVSAVIGAGVNPLYRGVYNFNLTPIGQAMHRLPDASSSYWVAVGSIDTVAAVQESGFPSYSGFQSYPPQLMWHQIDPSSRYRKVWNRLASVWWRDGAGPPVPHNPQKDLILESFDSCSSFVQRHIRYVLSDAPLSSKCVTSKGVIVMGKVDFRLYEVAQP